MGGTDKGRLGETDEGKVSGTDIKARVGISGTNIEVKVGMGRTGIEIRVGVGKANKSDVGRANKGSIDKADKGSMGGANIEVDKKACSRTVNKNNIGGAHKGGIGKANKGSMGEANIKADKKTCTGTIANTDNSANGGNKITNWYAGHTDLAFTAYASANYANNSNLTISKGKFSGATTSIFDDFFATFAALANITLKKIKIYEFNLFLFTANY